MTTRICGNVRETLVVSGTGAITTGTPAPGAIAFSAVPGITTSDTFPYAILDTVNGMWESGLGTYNSSGPTLTRTTVTNNSAGTTSALTFAGNLCDVVLLNSEVQLSAALAERASLGVTRGAKSVTFGTGADGAFSPSSGTTTLARDMHYTTLAPSGSAVIRTQNYAIYCSVALDLSNAPSGCLIVAAVTNGNNASGATGGTAGITQNSHTLPGSTSGSAGGAGTTGVGGAGTAATGNTYGNGGTGAIGGVGGAGVSAAGAAGTIGAITSNVLLPSPVRNFIAFPNAVSSVPIMSASGSSGGGAGGGDGTNAGGGGGSGAPGGGKIVVNAVTIIRGANTNVGIISVAGGTGGVGAAGVAGTAGGGGGGGGGSGGDVYLTCENLTGTLIANAIDLSGGAGGAGGNSPATHTGGTGGTGGAAGSAQMTVLSQTSVTTSIANGGALSASGFNATNFNTAGSAAVTASTTAGTAGGAGATLKVGL